MQTLSNVALQCPTQNKRLWDEQRSKKMRHITIKKKHKKQSLITFRDFKRCEMRLSQLGWD